MKKQYRMTDEELQSVLDASKPVPYLVFGGMAPPSPQENVNRAWAAIARAHGVRQMSIGPASTGDQRDFIAEPLPEEMRDAHKEAVREKTAERLK